MELTEVLNFAIPFKFDLDGFVTTGEVYKYLPDKAYWDDLKARGIIVESKAKELATELKEVGPDAASQEQAVKDISADKDKLKQLNTVYHAHLVGMLKSWDVTIKGDPVPISIEGMERVEAILSYYSTSLFNYLTEVRNENFRDGTVSSPGSPATVKTESVPTSIETDGGLATQPSTGTAPPLNS